ncbi:hypothetical protein TCAL_15457 [Tigriopus californicus]|uniref:Uncharacterized protein n=1 Tax=Tigriopus californicus TaxID=6832 RepID=A0A553PRQ7_TIGCA|nr:hypothetical protein TCAL_15457 [Tigriopus californicus]
MIKGSSKPYLQKMALQIFRKCKSLRISLSVIWRSRADPRLEIADDFSRAQDLDDWGVDDDSLAELWLRAGPFSIDLFASDLNHRLPTFVSKIASEKLIGRDAFLFDWSGFWQSFCLSANKSHQTSGDLIIPRWFSLYAWPLICSDGVHLNKLFRQTIFESNSA